jgi:tRNA dimethylallyltransferase
VLDKAAVLVLAGSTASGKTELALELAGRHGAEIVGADSRQIYRGMPIGTAVPSAEQRARIPHHLIEFLDPHERYSAAHYCSDALRVIREIRGRDRRVLVAGGTGFYIRALCGDVELSAAYDPGLRARLASEATIHPAEALHEWLVALAPERARAIEPRDRYRILRALEIALSGERALPSGQTERPSLRAAGLPFVKLALSIDDDVLDRRIAARVDGMLADGLLAEAESIGASAVAADAVGYPQALAYLAGQLTDAELRASLIRATRRYAKRQRSWFRAEPGMRFVSRDDAASEARELWETP